MGSFLADMPRNGTGRLNVTGGQFDLAVPRETAFFSNETPAGTRLTQLAISSFLPKAALTRDWK